MRQSRSGLDFLLALRPPPGVPLSVPGPIRSMGTTRALEGVVPLLLGGNGRSRGGDGRRQSRYGGPGWLEGSRICPKLEKAGQGWSPQNTWGGPQGASQDRASRWQRQHCVSTHGGRPLGRGGSVPCARPEISGYSLQAGPPGAGSVLPELQMRQRDAE